MCFFPFFSFFLVLFARTLVERHAAPDGSSPVNGLRRGRLPIIFFFWVHTCTDQLIPSRGGVSPYTPPPLCMTLTTETYFVTCYSCLAKTKNTTTRDREPGKGGSGSDKTWRHCSFRLFPCSQCHITLRWQDRVARAPHGGDWLKEERGAGEGGLRRTPTGRPPA